MYTKRIIPCLDVKDGRVVKGTNFVGLRDAGDPVELASVYDREIADELVFLDITASAEGATRWWDVVERTRPGLYPFYRWRRHPHHGGHPQDAKGGADKVSLNTAAVKNPAILADGANASASVHRAGGGRPPSWARQVGGVCQRRPHSTGIDVLEWVKKGTALGAGEILLTSMDRDGTKDGYDIPLTRMVSEAVDVPVIASGGAGELAHFYEVLTDGKADAVLAASVFHYGQFTIRQVKEYLRSRGVEVRL
jgi:cyclase